MILVIDNYDSFTFNLVQYFGDLGIESIVHRNDTLSVAEAMAIDAEAIVLSPGPCTPNDAGICCELIKAAASIKPILGVCLGHQAIGQVFGGKVIKDKPIHGKVSLIQHQKDGIFENIPNPLKVTRYHSLIVEKDSLPECLQPTAFTEDRIIMAIQHKSLPVYGVQFHPESIASDHGHDILNNFMTQARIWNNHSLTAV